MQPFTAEERADDRSGHHPRRAQDERRDRRGRGHRLATAISPTRCMWAALLALARAAAADLLTKWPVEYIYLAQLAVFVIGAAAHPVGGLALRHRAQIRQARPRASEGRRAVPGAEPAHHQGPHRRADLCVLRRALRRGDRRRGHLQEGAAGDVGRSVVDELTSASCARRARSRASSRAIETLRQDSRRAFPAGQRRPRTSCPTI